MKTLSKKDKDGKKDGDQEEESEEEAEQDQKSESDLYYYSKTEKKYKVFNPKTKSWVAQDFKPTE